MSPKDLLYAETHEWVRVGEEGGRKVGTVGITGFALEQLTDLVHMGAFCSVGLIMPLSCLVLSKFPARPLIPLA